MTNNAILQLIEWATRQLHYLNAIPNHNDHQKDLWIDLAYVVQQCGKLLNLDTDVDEYEMVEEVKELRERMDMERGNDEFTLMINQIRGFDADWDDDAEYEE